MERRGFGTRRWCGMEEEREQAVMETVVARCSDEREGSRGVMVTEVLWVT